MQRPCRHIIWWWLLSVTLAAGQEPIVTPSANCSVKSGAKRSSYNLKLLTAPVPLSGANTSATAAATALTAREVLALGSIAALMYQPDSLDPWSSGMVQLSEGENATTCIGFEVLLCESQLVHTDPNGTRLRSPPFCLLRSPSELVLAWRGVLSLEDATTDGYGYNAPAAVASAASDDTSADVQVHGGYADAYFASGAAWRIRYLLNMSDLDAASPSDLQARLRAATLQQIQVGVETWVQQRQVAGNSNAAPSNSVAGNLGLSANISSASPPPTPPPLPVLSSPPLPLRIVGHAMGGAIATLAANDLGYIMKRQVLPVRPIDLVSLGKPLVGDARLRQSLEALRPYPLRQVHRYVTATKTALDPITVSMPGGTQNSVSGLFASLEHEEPPTLLPCAGFDTVVGRASILERKDVMSCHLAGYYLAQLRVRAAPVDGLSNCRVWNAQPALFRGTSVSHRSPKRTVRLLPGPRAWTDVLPGPLPCSLAPPHAASALPSLRVLSHLLFLWHSFAVLRGADALPVAGSPSEHE